MLQEIGGSVRQRGYSGPWNALDVQSTQTEDREQMLVCFLESLEPDYSQILQVLLKHYALEIRRLIHALLDILECLGEKESRQAEIEGILRQVFVRAVANFDQLRDAESVRVWLSRAAVHAILAYRKKRRWQTLIHSTSSTTSKHEIHMDGLTEAQRLCVVLRYVHNLAAPDIAHILEISDETAHTHLIAARRTIQQEVSDSKGHPEPGKAEKHPEIRQQIQASLDGLLDNAPRAKMRLDQHLSTCAECQAHLDKAQQIASRLAETVQTRWPTPVLDPADLEQLAAIAQVKLRKTRAVNHFLVQFKALSLFGIVFLAALVALWGIRRADTHESVPLFPPTPGPPPTPIEASARVVRDISEREESLGSDVPEVVYHLDPSISADGSSIAFVSTADTLVAGDTNEMTDVFVVDRYTGVIERVSVSSDGVQGNGVSFNSRISADGRLVVFASLADNLVTRDGQSCVLGDDSVGSCLDIFTHDRRTGITERITLAYDGSEANGHSLLPTISPDGRWIVFWSEASNLVEKNGEESASNYWDVFVYDRETRVIGRVPIGRRETPRAPVHISDDGRYLAVVVQSGDSVAEQAGSTNYADVFVYDRQTDGFEPINVSSAGAPGNRESMNGVISPDGRYVAFVSQAGNLVEGDANNYADVFVRDRVAHTTERVSVSSDGAEGNNASGTLEPYGMSGGEQIGLSAGGRYVAFMSYADNLVALGANAYSPWISCNSVYIHDRQTGETALATRGQPGHGCFYPYLSISGNGQWLSLIEMLPSSDPLDLDFELLLHDRHTGLTENLLKERWLANQDTSTSSPKLSVQHYSAVHVVTFSPDGQIVATGASDGIVRLWRVSDGALLHTLEGHTRPVSGVAFFQDGTLLISSARDSTVGIWRVSDGALVSWLEEDVREILSLALSSDDSRVALGGFGAARVWEVDTEIFTLLDSQEYPGSYVNSLAFSPDGAMLALALSDNTIWLRRISADEPLPRLGGHADKVLSVAFSPDGRYLATGSEDNTLNLWQLDEKPDGAFEAQLVLTLEHPEWVKSLVFSPDGTVLASGTLAGNICLWSVPDGDLLKTLHARWDHILGVAFSPDGHTLASVTVGGHLRLWRIAELFPLRKSDYIQRTVP